MKRKSPAPIIAIHVLASIGVLYWILQIFQALTIGESSLGTGLVSTIALAVVLGGAHVMTYIWSAQGSRRVYAAIWLIVIGDSLLTIFVSTSAILLVMFTLVMLALTLPTSAREWLSRT